MATVITIRPGQLGARIKADARAGQRAIDQGVKLAANRIRDYLKSISPSYEGTFKNAWQVMRSASGLAGVSNASPVAGVIEAGARPHAVSAEGRQAIREWVRKVVTRVPTMRGPGRGKQGPPHKTSRALTHEEADGELSAWVDEITSAIVHKLKTKGQKGRWLVANNLDKFVRWTSEEVNRRIAAQLEKGGSV